MLNEETFEFEFEFEFEFGQLGTIAPSFEEANEDNNVERGSFIASAAANVSDENALEFATVKVDEVDEVEVDEVGVEDWKGEE